MKKRLTKKQKKGKEKLVIEEYKTTHITPLYEEEQLENEDEYNEDEFSDYEVEYVKEKGGKIIIPSNPSLTLRKQERSTYEFHNLIGDRIFESEDEVKDLINKYNTAIDNQEEVIYSAVDEIAQNIMYDAFDAKSSKKKITLAKKALSIYDKCCDAYNVLAEEAKTEDEAFEYYEKGLEAGEELLSTYKIKAPEGEYWIDIKMRPFLRTVSGFSDFLWEIGLCEKSIAFAFYLLEINKTDNQRMRFRLAYRLISENRFDDTRKLFANYKDDISLDTFFAQFLLKLMEKGITKGAIRDFEKAIKYNPTLFDYLLDHAKLPNKIPEFFSPGSKEEAIVTMFNIEPCIDDSTIFVKILLVLHMYLRDIVLAKGTPGVKKKDIELVNAMIQELEDILNDPEKIKKLNEDYD